MWTERHDKAFHNFVNTPKNVIFACVCVENAIVFQLLDRSPGNPVDEENQPPDLMRETLDEKLRQDARIQDDKQRQLVDIPTNEGSQRPKWEKILHVSVNALSSNLLQCSNSYLYMKSVKLLNLSSVELYVNVTSKQVSSWYVDLS